MDKQSSSEEKDLSEALNVALNDAIAVISTDNDTDAVKVIKWSELAQILNDTGVRAKLRQNLSLTKDTLYLCSEFEPPGEPFDSKDNHCVSLIMDGTFDEKSAYLNDHLDLVVSLHSNVHTISVQYGAELNSMFALLLQRWSSMSIGRMLTELIIDGGSYSDEVNTEWWKAIASVSSLQRLVWTNMPSVPPQIRSELDSLLKTANLTEVTVTHYQSDLVPVLLLLLGCCALRSVHLVADKDRVKHYDLTLLEHTLTAHPQMGHHLKRLHLSTQHPYNNDGDESNRAYVRFTTIVCTHFPGLRSLSISPLRDVPLEQVLVHLQCLSSLTDLHLSCALESFDSEQSDKFDQFKSVNSLVLDRTLRRDYTIERFEVTIGRLFPNLTELHVASNSAEFVRELSTRIRMLFPRMQNAWVQEALADELVEVCV